MYFVILSKDEKYCATVSSSVYAKLIERFSFELYENNFNFRVVKCSTADSEELKSKISILYGFSPKK